MKGSTRQRYPSSLMGSTALLRQTYYDAKWYKDASKKGLSGGTNLSLEAFNKSQDLPQIFSAGSWKDILRATTIGDEFGVNYIVLGGGDSYQRANAISEILLGSNDTFKKRNKSFVQLFHFYIMIQL